MKSITALTLLPALSLIAGVQATWSNGTIWTTVTVQTLTTYCPEATTFTHGTKTYTATAHETLTITDCPCTTKVPVKPTHIPSPPPASSHIPPTSKVESLPPVSVTITVSEYTTYCPYPTVFPVGPNSTITVYEPTTLTITNCPCTLTKPAVVTTTVSYITTFCPEPTTLTIGTSTHIVPAGTVKIPVEHVTIVPAPETTKSSQCTKVGGCPPPPEVTKSIQCTKDCPPAPETSKSPACTKSNGCPPAVSTIAVQTLTLVPASETTKPAITQNTSSQNEVPPVTTQPPTQIPVGTGSLPSTSTTSFLEANYARKRDAGFGAIFAAGIAAALL